ncbi:transposase, partial [Propionibacterium freudenreichii]|nr:transposase [Propionibacterium freudenreichii]
RGQRVCLRTASRWLERAGVSRLRGLGPTGATNHRTGRIIARFPGHMIHLDVKKVGRISDGGGWRVHGRGNVTARRVGYTYLHCAVDGYSRLAYTESLDDETAITTIGSFCRARDFVTAMLEVAARHQPTRPYTPRHNQKVERFNRLLVGEVGYVWLYDIQTTRRTAIGTWNHHYNYPRPHTAATNNHPPPARRQRHDQLHPHLMLDVTVGCADPCVSDYLSLALLTHPQDLGPHLTN